MSTFEQLDKLVSQLAEVEESILKSNELVAAFQEDREKVLENIQHLAAGKVVDNKIDKKKPGRPKGTTKKKPGRPKGATNKKSLVANKKKPGRPKGTTNKKSLVANKKKPGRPKGTTKKKPSCSAGAIMQEAVWNALDRTEYPIYLDVPEGQQGLRIIEIQEVIKKEELRISESKNISTQVSMAVHELCDMGKVAKNENRRYNIVEGATLAGPSLDEQGNAITKD